MHIGQEDLSSVETLCLFGGLGVLFLFLVATLFLILQKQRESVGPSSWGKAPFPARESPTPFIPVPIADGGMTNATYTILIHLSCLLVLIPFLFPIGTVVPIVLWLLKKDRDPLVDESGRNACNLAISSVIYLGIVGIFTLIGISWTIQDSTHASSIWDFSRSFSTFAIAAAIVSLIRFLIFAFVIVGVAKASQGIAWKYPLAIPFLKSPRL